MLIYLTLILFTECILAQNQVNNQSQSTDYQSVNLYEINQKRQINNTKNMLLNLTINGQALTHNSFLVIDIDLTSTQTFQTAFVACLNFNYDILQDTTFQNAGAYSFQYMDVNATQQQITQHLIVIKTSEQIFRNNSRAYLTIFYLENPNDFLSQNKQLKNPIDYVVVTYYSSWYPCHYSCNNLNGSCNQKIGQYLLCSKYNNLNINDTRIVNYGDAQITNQCFLVLAIKQTMSQSQFSLVDIQLQFQTSSTQDNSNHKNQVNQQISKSQPQQLNSVQIAIILVCSLSGMCILIFFLRVLKRKLETTNQDRNLNINNLQNEVLAQSFFNFVNSHAQNDKIKQLIMQKKLVLQEYFMPTILYLPNVQQSVNKTEIQKNNSIADEIKIQNEQNNDKQQKINHDQIQPDLQGQVISPTQKGFLGFKAIQIVSNSQAGIKYLDEENKNNSSQQYVINKICLKKYLSIFIKTTRSQNKE
ncbi:hypothetical protein ABPG72_018699 [Tetrahymena utriculariae]